MPEEWIKGVRTWADNRPDVMGVLLVGSHTRGSATPASDIDFVLLVTDTRPYLSDRTWARAFGEVEREELEDWGRVQCLRIWYGSGAEVEWGLATVEWIGVPLDSGTKHVLLGGYRIIYDRDGVLESRLAPLNLDRL
jgi:predicted nucleotidyltransferase